MTREEINQFSMRISQSNRTQIVVITYEIIINYLDSARDSFDNSNVTDFVPFLYNYLTNICSYFFII